MNPDYDARPPLLLDHSSDRPLELFAFTATAILIAGLTSCFTWAFVVVVTGGFFESDEGVFLSEDGEDAGRYYDLPASSIAANNLAPDGGGMSPNNGGASDLRVVFNADRWSSDGDSRGVSNDALVFFRYAPATTQVNPSHEGELFVTQFDNSSFTAPTRLFLPDSGLSAVTSGQR